MIPNKGLNIFSKIVCLSTLFLIFAGGMVTSTGSGLAVPDWPLSYGSLFPPMVGGVFYEHGHRMIASLVGLLTLILAIWIGLKEPRKWVKVLGYYALAAVILQGILGGITVTFMLPTPVSVSHAVLAQTFFILTIILAYSQSFEFQRRINSTSAVNGKVIKMVTIVVIAVYLQLIVGAIMRHTHSGLAIPDFPKMGGMWLPQFNDSMLATINLWRFDNDMDPVTQGQVVIHFLHRLGAVAILILVCLLHGVGLKYSKNNRMFIQTLVLLEILIAIQVILGILTVLTLKSPVITSFHVMTGAATLGVSVLLILRSAPVTWNSFKSKLLTHDI